MPVFVGSLVATTVMAQAIGPHAALRASYRLPPDPEDLRRKMDEREERRLKKIPEIRQLFDQRQEQLKQPVRDALLGKMAAELTSPGAADQKWRDELRNLQGAIDQSHRDLNSSLGLIQNDRERMANTALTKMTDRLADVTLATLGLADKAGWLKDSPKLKDIAKASSGKSAADALGQSDKVLATWEALQPVISEYGKAHPYVRGAVLTANLLKATKATVDELDAMDRTLADYEVREQRLLGAILGNKQKMESLWTAIKKLDALLASGRPVSADVLRDTIPPPLLDELYPKILLDEMRDLDSHELAAWGTPEELDLPPVLEAAPTKVQRTGLGGYYSPAPEVAENANRLRGALPRADGPANAYGSWRSANVPMYSAADSPGAQSSVLQRMHDQDRRNRASQPAGRFDSWFASRPCPHCHGKGYHDMSAISGQITPLLNQADSAVSSAQPHIGHQSGYWRASRQARVELGRNRPCPHCRGTGRVTR